MDKKNARGNEPSERGRPRPQWKHFPSRGRGRLSGSRRGGTLTPQISHRGKLARNIQPIVSSPFASASPVEVVTHSAVDLPYIGITAVAREFEAFLREFSIVTSSGDEGGDTDVGNAIRVFLEEFAGAEASALPVAVYFSEALVEI